MTPPEVLLSKGLDSGLHVVPATLSNLFVGKLLGKGVPPLQPCSVAPDGASAAATARPTRGAVMAQDTARRQASSASRSSCAKAAAGSWVAPKEVRRSRTSADRFGRCEVVLITLHCKALGCQLRKFFTESDSVLSILVIGQADGITRVTLPFGVPSGFQRLPSGYFRWHLQADIVGPAIISETVCSLVLRITSCANLYGLGLLCKRRLKSAAGSCV